MAVFAAIAKRNACAAMAETRGGVVPHDTRTRPKPRSKFYVRAWWSAKKPLPCAQSRVFFGRWHEVKQQVMLPCKPRYKGFDSLEEAAKHEHFQHMLPFEADDTVRAMPGAAAWTTSLSPEEATLAVEARSDNHTCARVGMPTRTTDAYSAVSTTALRATPTKRRRVLLASGEAVSATVSSGTTASPQSRWRLDLPLEPVFHTAALAYDVPSQLHIATDGSVLDMNDGSPDACGGVGVAWQWGTLEATRGSFQKPMPWNNGGQWLGAPHTNISTEWMAVIEAMTLVALKFHSRTDAAACDVRGQVHLRFYIDCKAVLQWLQRFAASLPLATAPTLTPTTESNWVLKSRASMLLATHLHPWFASVTFHWVRAHRSDRAILDVKDANERLAAQLNREADQAAKTAATLYRLTFGCGRNHSRAGGVEATTVTSSAKMG